MRYVDHFAHQVRMIEHLMIPVRDGTHLAARIWMPVEAERQPVPAILEYIPYRKRDGTRQRDELHHPYFAGHGYAAVRVDLRGSGDSEGVLTDEYLEQELADAEDVIGWLSQQPWCDGTVGMMGISWGGFNALQVASRHPPALGAVISVASTDDRYADDVHYMGGCLLGDNLSWASTMFAYNSLPPDPELVDDWREQWHARLEGSGLWLDTWLRHQHRDDYWRHGSVAANGTSIQVPVMAVSGWADGYSNAVFRLMEQLDVPRMGLVGPWSHKYPHLGTPGPAIGWLQECVAWWDRWLKGIDNGIEARPILRVWMQDSHPPFPSYEHRPGRWVAQPAWPSPDTQWRSLRLTMSHQLAESPQESPDPDSCMLMRSPLTTGLFAGKWASYADAPDLPGDQQEEDGGALVFETAPLEEDIELLGAPVMEVELACDAPVAMFAARLSDVRPDKQATRLSYGLLNLTHRDDHANPQPLIPGRRIHVRIELNDLAQHIPAGNRLRLSLSSSYWPLAWLPPRPARIDIFPASSALHLPLLRGARRNPDTPLQYAAFGPPEAATPGPTTLLEPPHTNWRVIRDLGSGESLLEIVNDSGLVRLDDIELTVGRHAFERYSVTGSDASSARGETWWQRSLQRRQWRIRTATWTRLTCDPETFYLDATLDAYEGDRRVHSQNWNRRIERQHV